MKDAYGFALDALAMEAATSGMAKSPTDSAEAFEAYHGVMKYPLIEAGNRMRRDLMPKGPENPWRYGGLYADGVLPPAIGFFMPTATLLAHSVNLLTFLDALAQLGSEAGSEVGNRSILPIVYTFGDRNPEFDEAFQRHTVKHILNENLLDSWLELRDISIRDGLDAMVFVSVVQSMAFATALGVAPKHIWWAHKWHGLSVGAIDGYLDACHPFDETKEIAGRTWKCTYTALPELLDESQTERALEIREGIGVQTIFGWMGRAEKMSDQYIEAVATILKDCPDSIFVYTGREDTVWRKFAEHGVDKRTSFLGWVNTRLWAQVIDVYLDTFPFQSGHCAYEAMAAYKPVVWLHDEKTAEEQSASALVQATWEDGAREVFYGLQPWVEGTAAYCGLALQLHEDESLRITHGTAFGVWIGKYMMDAPRMAESVSTAILDIVNR